LKDFNPFQVFPRDCSLPGTIRGLQHASQSRTVPDKKGLTTMQRGSYFDWHYFETFQNDPWEPSGVTRLGILKENLEMEAEP
jgi:hypothetical protein